MASSLTTANTCYQRDESFLLPCKQNDVLTFISLVGTIVPAFLHPLGQLERRKAHLGTIRFELLPMARQSRSAVAVFYRCVGRRYRAVSHRDLKIV